MKARALLVLTVGSLLGFLLASQAQEGSNKGPSAAKIRDDAVLREQILANQYSQFVNDLNKLIVKLKRSSKEGDKERAEVLEKVLETAKTNLIGVKFEEIIGQLKESSLNNTAEIRLAAERSAKIAEELRRLIDLYRQDPRQAKLRDEIARLKEIIAELDKAIHNQKVTQGITDANKTDKNELGKIQNKNTQQVAKLLKKMAGEGQGKGDPKSSKGDPKEGKGKGKPGESKDVGKKPDKGQPKDPGKAPDKGTQVAKAEPKAGEKSPGDGKPGSKSGEPKQASAKGSKGDPKSGEPKAGGDPKQGEAKPGESQQGQPKPGGDQGQQKPDSGPQKPQPPQGPKDNIADSRKKVEEGNYQQKAAEDDIAKGKNPEASKDQDRAIEKFEDAKKKLEELLRQLREEELERTLADLLRRCERMLAMQIAVYNGTKGVDAAVKQNADKQPSRENKQDSLRLSDNEGEIVVEARKAIEVLEAEGSAVAFPEVFQQVRDDMIHVQRRLGVTDVGEITQTIEQDIIDSLKEMIEALKKAKQDLQDKKNNPSPPGQSPPQDSKLLELIQELKLIRSLQLRVNTRTKTYGRMYEAKEGEQTSNPNIRRELNNLSERQERIYEVTNRLAKGDNK
ncbi:MAG: hypothetical protein L0Y71_04165 [Gemmataceae bacterium]|nr:hypothetical protein [Gemmataceae bacterium]